MDSTMIGQECIDELADFAGLKAHVAAITERAMRGEIAFEPALRERVALLKGLPQSVVDEVIDERITLTPGGRDAGRDDARERRLYLPGLRRLHAVHRPRSRAMIGFDEHRANVAGGRRRQARRDRCSEPILGREAKLATLLELRERLGLRREDTLAVGDGANDLADDRGRGPRRRLSRQAGGGASRARRASTTAISPRCSMCRAIAREEFVDADNEKGGLAAALS